MNRDRNYALQFKPLTGLTVLKFFSVLCGCFPKALGKHSSFVSVGMVTGDKTCDMSFIFPSVNTF